MCTRFGDENFKSFHEIFNGSRAGDNWSTALMNVGHWRQAILLRGAESKKIEGNEIKVLQPIDGSHGLKLGIPEHASVGEIERALHVAITMLGIGASQIRDVLNVGGKVIIDTEARKQVANVLSYISEVLGGIKDREGAERLRPLYEEYNSRL